MRYTLERNYSKVQADKELASAVDNAKITKVYLKMLCVWCALIVP